MGSSHAFTTRGWPYTSEPWAPWHSALASHAGTSASYKRAESFEQLIKQRMIWSGLVGVEQFLA